MAEERAGTEAGRAWWWAVLRTERDRRLALARGRPITSRNLWRLLRRRLGRAVGQTWEGQLDMNSIESRFVNAFQELTSYCPYPWQQQLFARLSAGGPLDGLDIPTGLGKTSVMPIWLLAHRYAQPDCRPPMRLVYVVNRRTIVDQATKVAESLQKKAGEDKLAVSTLRGALADNGDWLMAPHLPAIIIGTVDMIGSRLLFNAYRAGRWQRSRHAGLLGQDSLIVHDEAHLSQPFQGLLEWIVARQADDNSPRRMRLLAMSATHSNGQNKTVLTLDREDLGLKEVQKRLYAPKRLKLHDATKNLPAQLAALALVHEAIGQDAKRVIIFVKLPEMAKKVVQELKKGKVGDDRIEVLTGTIRGFERDLLVQQPVVDHLLKSTTPQATEYLVSTSAGEVGADFDADHMVCDLTPIDSFIQRVGRVNRRGDGDARIDLVMDLKADAKARPHEAAANATAKLLAKLPPAKKDVDRQDACPQALRDLREQHAAEYAPCVAPQPQHVTPHDVTLDAWSLTSIQADWPLAQEVAPFLHGLDDADPQTFVAWRAELDELEVPSQGQIDSTPVQQSLDHYPLRPQELLHDKPDRVAELLLAARARCGEKPFAWIIGRKIEVWRLLDLTEDAKRLEQEVRNRTIVLPVSVGGLNAGMIDTGSDSPVLDVADRQETARARVLLTRDDEGWRQERRLGDDSPPADDAEPPEFFPKWTAARHAAGRKLGMRYVARVVLSEDEQGPSQLLLLFHEHAPKEKLGAKLHLAKHNEDVDGKAEERIKALGLAADSVEAKALRSAASHHDCGKADERWQRAIGNSDGSSSLAKSLNRGINARLLAGYRHEFGSLLKALESDGFRSLDDATRDLALHLIATHHGRGRPYFSTAAMKTPVNDLPDFLQPAEIARRFDRLQRRYGHWGLAWLESILRSADAEASRMHDAPAVEDEEEEDER